MVKKKKKTLSATNPLKAIGYGWKAGFLVAQMLHPHILTT
jgi:hypothetical protein